MKGYKGFNKDMKCRDMQYEEGKIYEMKEKPKCCDGGYHFCEYPLDCFNYYSPADSVYHEVEALGDTDKEENSDTKVATNKIKIGAKINFKTMSEMAIEFTYKHCKKGGKGSNKRTDYSVASNAGNYSVASNAGNYSVASNTGNNSVASNTGYCSVASNTGNNSVASNTGDKSISSNLGISGKAAGKIDTWLVLSEWVENENYDYEVKEVKTVKVDGKKIKENTYYSLENGKFVKKGVANNDNN